MVEGRVRHDWRVAAEIMAMQANCHRDPKKRAIQGKDLIRFGDEQRKMPGSIQDLKFFLPPDKRT